MTVNWGVSIEEAIEAVAILTEASKEPLRILDVGGGMRPLIFATDVIDILDYENYGENGYLPIEAWKNACRFKEENCTKADICTIPWKYHIKQFDVIWCSDTIGMLRDPIAVLKEMSRIGRTGYIRFVHRSYESLPQVEDGSIVGYGMNRWLIEPAGNRILFTYKHPIIHFSYTPTLTGNQTVGLWWTDEIVGVENILLGNDDFNKNAEQYMKESEDMWKEQIGNGKN